MSTAGSAASTGIVVASSSEVPEGGRIVVDIGGTEIGVFRVGEVLRAWENLCIHMGGPVCQGKMINRVIERLDDDMRSLGDDFAPAMHVVCPWHGYEFDLATGAHPSNPDMRLRAFPVHETDGEIYVEL